MRSAALLAALLLVAAPAARAADTLPHYKVDHRISLPGDSGWDYLFADTLDHRLYIAHSSEVQVLDLDTEKLIGSVPGFEGAHGIAVSHLFGKGYGTSGRDSTVIEFDLKTLGVTQRIPVKKGRFPDAIVYEPAIKFVYSMNGGTHNATSIATETGVVQHFVELEGKPEFAVADGHGAIFVNIEDSSWVAGFDAKDKAPRVRWKLAPGEEPTGLAYDAEHRVLFSVCANKLMVIMDAMNGKVLQTLPIGEGCDGVAWDPVTRMAFASCGDGTMTVVREDALRHFVVHEVVKTAKGARTVAVDPRTHRVYTCTAKFGDTPKPTKEQPRPRPRIEPGSFEVLVLTP